MPTFRYMSRDASGSSHSGVVAAGSMKILTAELRSRGLLVIDLEAVGGSEAGDRLSWNPRTWLRGNRFDAELGFQQLAVMLHSGLSLLTALRTVADQARRPRAAAVWRAVAERVEHGSTFGNALAQHPKMFPHHAVQLVSVGEATGNLDSALERAAGHLERSRQLRLTVINALAYPAIVTLMATGVALFLVGWVIPKLEKYLNARGRSLPPLTQTMLDSVAFARENLPLVAILLAAGCLGVFFVRRWPPGRLTTDRILLRLPVIGSVLKLSGTANVSRGLSVLLESGVTLLEGLRTAGGLVGNRAQAARIESTRETVLRGGTLAAGLGAGTEFLPMLPRMAAVGESAGTLPPVLDDVARFHENQLLAFIRRMSVLIEPVIIVVVGGIVGFVYIAFFLALFSLAGGIR